MDDLKNLKNDLASESADLGNQVRTVSFNYYSILLLKVNEMSYLQEQNQQLNGKYAELSKNLVMFLKRYVYTQERKNQIQTKQQNLAVIKERVVQIKNTMNLYEQIDTAVSQG